MTCNGCRTHVEETLNNLEGIKAEVNLEKEEVIIHSDTMIALQKLQEVLPAKYSISEEQGSTIIPHSEIATTSQWKQLFPLFLIFSYITIAAVLLNNSPWNITAFMLDFMGLFYIVFSFFKMLDLKGFPTSFRMYDPLAKIVPTYAYAYPFIETALGILFLMRLQIPIALWITIVILGITTFGVTKTLLDKKTIQCACLGTALKLPMTKATFIENSIMLIMAIWMLFHLD